MKLRVRPAFVVWALVGAVVATGCGGDDGSPDGSTTSSDRGAGLFTPEELSAALLTAEDLGSGWTESQRDTFTTRSPENPSVEESLSFCPESGEQAATLSEAFDRGLGEQWTDDAGNQVTFEVLDGPQVGDESTSVTDVVVLETPDGEVAYRGPFTVARFGTVLMAIGDLTIGRPDEPVPPSEPDWSTIVETAAANLDELTGD